MTIEQLARFWAARYGGPVWLVGSALSGESARDLDVRIVLPDAQFERRWGPLGQWTQGQTTQRLVDEMAHLNRNATSLLPEGTNPDVQIWPASYAARAFPEGERRLVAAPRERNWDLALHELRLSLVGAPFVWGETDCVSVVRRSWELVFGGDLLEHLPHYASGSEARAALSMTGGLGMAMLDHGALTFPLTFAQTGDVVNGPEDPGHGFPFVGLVVGREVLTSTMEQGVIAHPLSACPEGCSVLRWHDGP